MDGLILYDIDDESDRNPEERPFPFLPTIQPTTDPPAYVDLYRRSRERFVTELGDAAIEVERIPHVVLVAGGDDQVWPAVQQAEAIRDRRAAHGRETILVTDPDAGHRTILPGEPVIAGGARMRRGGTETADRRLGHSAWACISGLL